MAGTQNRGPIRTPAQQHGLVVTVQDSIAPQADETSYYAIPDPTDPATMTFWRFKGERIEPWPANAKQGPRLYRHQVPTDLRGETRRQWIYRWVREVRDPWFKAILDAVNADRNAARHRFAQVTIRCYRCASKLTDPQSQLLGIGPECRGGGKP